MVLFLPQTIGIDIFYSLIATNYEILSEISRHVDEGTGGGNSLRRPGSEDPHRCEQTFLVIAPKNALIKLKFKHINTG